MSKQMYVWAAAGAVAVLLAGCYSYPAPPSSTLGESYTQRQKDAADELFKTITSLTLNEAQRISLKNNPNYISAYYSVEAARMRYYQSLGAYSPTITADFTLQNAHSWVTSYNHRYDPGYSSETPRMDNFITNTGVTANLLVFDGLARWFKVQAAKHGETYYKRLEEDACRTMMYSVAYAYNAVLLAIEKRRIAEENLKFQMSSLKDAQYKFKAGAVPLSDVLNFEILANNADVDMITAESEYETAIYALAVLMGYPEGTLPAKLKFPSDFKSNYADLVAVDIYLDTALANRPDLKGYREQREIAKYKLYQTYSSYSPVVNAFVNMDFGTEETRNRGYTMGNTRDYYSDLEFSYGFTANWTIFNGFIRYNQVREAKAALAVEDYKVANQWFTVVREVRTAYTAYIQSVRETKLYKKTRDLSAKQRDLVDDEYRAGNAELTRLNEAQRDLVQAETNLAKSYINIQNAKAQLDSVVGANTAEYYLDPKNDPSSSVPGLGSVAKNAALKQEQQNSAPGKASNDKKKEKDQKGQQASQGNNKVTVAPVVLPAKKKIDKNVPDPSLSRLTQQSDPQAAEPAKTVTPVPKAAEPAKTVTAAPKTAEPAKTVTAAPKAAEPAKSEKQAPEEEVVPQIPASPLAGPQNLQK